MSIDFNQTAAEIIEDALLEAGGLAAGESPSTAQYKHARRALNRMLKAWQKQSLMLWKEKKGSLTLVVDKSVYTIGAGGDYTINRPLGIRNVRRKVDGIEVPIDKVSREEYFNQPNKTVTGKPVMAYYDPQLTTGSIYLWPTPDSASDTIEFDYEDPIQDLDENSDIPDFPVEFLEAVHWNLALRLCARYECPDRQMVMLMAESEKEEAFNSDDNEESVFFGIDHA